MRGKIVIYLTNGQIITIVGVRESDYERLLGGDGITTDYQVRVVVNQNNIAAILFEPEQNK